jgi:hypothetical protein
MTEELGKIEKPEVEKFAGSRKLFFVPLIYSPPESESDFLEKVHKYWDEVENQVANLEFKLGSVTRVYHELIFMGGEEGSQAIEKLNGSSYQIVRKRLDRGAIIEPIEDAALLTEFMDWSRCLTIGLQNPNVVERVYEAYSSAHLKRNEDMAKKINETLKDDDIGILLMRESHQVQFPADIEVFYIAPPGLDEIKRWIRDKQEKLQAEMDQHPED